MSYKLSTEEIGQNADIIQMYLLCSENSFYKFFLASANMLVNGHVNMSSQLQQLNPGNHHTLSLLEDFCIYCIRIIHNLHVSDCVPADLHSHTEPPPHPPHGGLWTM